jgi:hypothetical protein
MNRLCLALRSVCLVVAVLGGQGCGGSHRIEPQRQAQLITSSGAITATADDMRTGWYPNQPSLSPGAVSGGGFGRLWSRVLPLNANEQVFAQPLVVDNTIFVATEENDIYSLDADTGAVLASRALGPAWASANVACNDLNPDIGITGTPVIDNNSKTAYFFSKEWQGSQSNVSWFAHAVDVFTLAEKPNFPVLIQGTASNVPITFSAFRESQRPALLLLNGVIYAGFGSHCDGGNYQGFVVGVSTSGTITTLFATTASRGNGVWMSNAGMMSDGPGRLFFATGNGFTATTESPQSAPSVELNEAVVRLNVSGTPFAADFFSPFNRTTMDMADTDFGAGGPVGLPSAQFGTPTHPNLAIIAGKSGTMYLLDRDNLGGFKQGASGADAVVSAVPAPATWSKPGVWPGDGGYVYVVGSFATMRAYKYGLNGSGVPQFSNVAGTSDSFGFSSGAPIVTSDGTTSGSALVWVTFTTGSYGTGQLRAYDAVPAGGALTLRYSDTYGTSAKFSSPGVGNGRLYVGTGDGRVVAYGSPFSPSLSAPSMNFGPVAVGTNAVQTMTLTASQSVTVTAMSVSGAAFSSDAPTPSLPATLPAGGTMTVPIHFTPGAVQPYAGSLDVTTSSGPISISLSGQGQASGPVLTVAPSTLVSFGGIARDSTTSLNLTLSNGGSQALTWNGFVAPLAPYSVTGLPPVGSTLAPNASVVISLQFAPTANGMFSDTFQIQSTGGDVTVFLSGSAADPGTLTITPTALDFGAVTPGGAPVSRGFNISNMGASAVTIAKSKPPALGVFTAQTRLDEGSVIQPGQTVVETVTFAPTAAGSFTDQWIITGGGTSAQTITFTGVGASGSVVIGEPNILALDDSANGSWMIAQPATLGQTGTIQSISFYVAAAAGKLRLGIYDASGPNGDPGVKKAETAELTPGAGWVTANVVTPVTLPAGTYWLAFLASSDAMVQRKAVGQAVWYQFPYAVMPGTFSTTAEHGTVHYSIYATLNVGPANPPPTVATAAAASPNPTSGSTSALSVLGADDGGEPALTYTWATTGVPPAAVSFSPNASNAAKNSTATFSKAGTYNLQVTIADGQGGTVTSPVVVTVSPTVTSVVVTPASPQVATGATQQFTATAADQFGVALASQPSFTWSVSGGGTISGSGLFTAGSSAGGPFTVTASTGARSGTASVTVTAVTSSLVIGEPNILPSDDSANGSWMIAQPAALGQSGTIQSISFFVATAAGKLRLGIYDASGANGDPGVKKAETAELTPGAGWVTANVITPVTLPAGNYWLAFLASSDLMHQRKGPGPAVWYPFTYGTMPGTFGAGPEHGKVHYSLYATLNLGPPNQPPTVAAAATASPNPTSGNTSALSVLGADDAGEPGLTYTWATTGAPPAAVTFSPNGSNAAKNSTATFSKVGTYNLQVTIADGQGGTVTSPVAVTVNPTVTSVVVTPASPQVSVNATQQFTATASDQFGVTLASQPSVTWSVSGGGTISASGLFTAGSASGGPFTVTADTGTRSGTASVTVTPAANQPPTVAMPASGSPNPVTGTTTALGVLGADDAGEANLTYNWATTGSPPAAVFFFSNGTNAAKNTVVTFAKVGVYNFQVTIVDAQGLSVTSTTSVTVSPTLTTVTVAPASANVTVGQNQTFTASGKDQFGATLASQPAFAWSVNGGGTISASGIFTAGGSPGGPFTVTASSGGQSGTASVSVVAAPNQAPTVATAAAATPSPTTGTSTALSVAGADDGGAANLTYTWTTTGTPPAAVTFSANGTNAASNTTASFSKVGSYTFQATITDAQGLTATSSVTVAVNAALTTVVVAPATASVAAGSTQTFTATGRDQFGANLVSQPAFTWSVTGGGTISSAGVFSATTAGGPFTVTATSASRSGTASVTVTAATASFNIGEPNVQPANDTGNGNWLLAQEVTLSQSATVQSFSFYLATAAGKLRLGLYDASGPNGDPGVKKAEAAEIVTTKTGWNTAAAVTGVTLPAGKYWLAFLPSSNSQVQRKSTDGQGKALWFQFTYGALPATFGTPAGREGIRYSSYATMAP